MWTTTETLRLMAAALLAVYAALLLRDHRHDRSALATLALIVAAVCHIVEPLVLPRAAPGPLLHGLVLLGLAVPPTFWILAHVHFDDDCCLTAWHWLAFAAFEAVGYAAWLASEGAPPLAARGEVLGLAHMLLSLSIVAHALVSVYVGSRGDLVVSRLRLRYWLLGVTGGYVLVDRTLRAATEGTASQAAVEWAYAVSVFALAFGVLSASALVQPGVLKPSRPAAPADPRLVEQLTRLVEVEQLFREEGLTIAALASRLGAPEYRVRQLVNAQLGFRNFNAFLHHYRLKEAQRALLDPAKRHLTVAQVAFEVGYSSLGPFNRAFKEVTGLTPTEFRAPRHEPRANPVQAIEPEAGNAPSPGATGTAVGG